MRPTKSAPPTGCQTAEQHEVELTKLATDLAAQADVMLKRGGIDAARGKELALASIRARKLAAELAQEREGWDHSREIMAHEREMAGVGRRASGRPRLKFGGGR
jgi:hypothetical protein